MSIALLPDFQNFLIPAGALTATMRHLSWVEGEDDDHDDPCLLVTRMTVIAWHDANAVNYHTPSGNPKAKTRVQRVAEASRFQSLAWALANWPGCPYGATAFAVECAIAKAWGADL